MRQLNNNTILVKCNWGCSKKFTANIAPSVISIMEKSNFDGIQTLNLRICSQTWYHCTTRSVNTLQGSLNLYFTSYASCLSWWYRHGNWQKQSPWVTTVFQKYLWLWRGSQMWNFWDYCLLVAGQDSWRLLLPNPCLYHQLKCDLEKCRPYWNGNIGFLTPQMIIFPKMYNLAHPQNFPLNIK